MITAETHRKIVAELERRVLVLDGAMGTMIQRHGLTESDYRGSEFADSPGTLKGCHDLLTLTRPDIIRDIHRQYLEAGADIITTNTFNANAISLSDYDLGDYAYTLNVEAAKIARREADRRTDITPGRPRFVAGTVGPTNKTASMSSDIMNPAQRDVTFDRLKDAYLRQVEGLLDGGCDIILVETVFDTLNAKAALYAVNETARTRGIRIPLMVSATVSDASGRTLSGQTLEAFYASVSHADLLAVGLNCAFGPDQLIPYVERLSAIAECRVSCHPNAGLPNALGQYDETPQSFVGSIRHLLESRSVNIVGGCCGTTPEHIRELAAAVGGNEPRPLPRQTHHLTLSNLEALNIGREAKFINIGERTNVAGSAKFARLIREGNYAEAVNVALRQIEAGASVIDVCMDDALIDGVEAMRTFLNLIASEPEIARVPVMIDSSRWDVIEAGLQSCQGKGIVNSISLKEGETAFLKKAEEIRKYGAAVVVMLFDEEGQATTYARKCEVAERSYRLLTEAGFPAEDIIFDPNILTVATGIAEHERYAIDFIEAVRWIKTNLPYARVSGGVSNLSFAFRGNNPIREAMHSVFLYHAIEAGLDMAIVNAQMLRVYSDIEPELLTRIEDVILARRADATERLIEYAASAVSEATDVNRNSETEAEIPAEERLRRALIKGTDDNLAELVKEVLPSYASALEVIDRVLMPAMDHIGSLFGQGKMFLPQVIKSARVLKQAISFLAPSIEAEGTAKTGRKVIVATVRGDIHDIGKNIVALVVGCNGYDITDLGVMADAGVIADEAERIQPLAVMLSGLITPSLNEMVEVCKELERRGLNIPVIIGGATTSPLHTALKIAPVYSSVVIHAPDASYNSRFLSRLASEGRNEFINEVRQTQQRLRDDYEAAQSRSTGVVAIEEARRKSKPVDIPSPEPCSNDRTVFTDFDIEDVEPYINWDSFYAAWGLNRPGHEHCCHSEKEKVRGDALTLLEQIKRHKDITLQAVLQVFGVHSDNDDIVIETGTGNVRLPMLRDQSASRHGECVADLVAAKNDHICLFALTAGVGLRDFCERLRSQGDDYGATLAKLLADRLAEAFAEKLHSMVRREIWGFEKGDELSADDMIKQKYRGCRLAFGYPAVPDHTLKRDVFHLLDVEQSTSMRITGNDMIIPEESVCGIILSQGDYFAVSRVAHDQLNDYAARRGTDADTLKKLLPFNILQ